MISPATTVYRNLLSLGQTPGFYGSAETLFHGTPPQQQAPIYGDRQPARLLSDWLYSMSRRQSQDFSWSHEGSATGSRSRYEDIFRPQFALPQWSARAPGNVMRFDGPELQHNHCDLQTHLHNNPQSIRRHIGLAG